MKRVTFILSLLFVFEVVVVFSQAKKPTLMVIPSDNWCIVNGYYNEFVNQGTVTKIPNYKKALQESSELISVISKINGLMAERGFPLKNMESVLKTLESESAENAMLTSKSGSEISEISEKNDKLKQIAKADIIIQLTWIVNTLGPKKSIRFELQGLDSYTDKQIAQAGGSGAPSVSAEVPVLLEEAVIAHLDKFNSDLQTHFDDLFTNGREIILRIKTFHSWDGDLEKKYGNEELGSVIESWLQHNTVKGRFNTTDATESSMLFEQVRIPLLDNNGKALDTRGFAKELKKYLEATPYNITCKLMTKGLGQAVLVLGEK
jgi:hypothetical protein